MADAITNSPFDVDSNAAADLLRPVSTWDWSGLSTLEPPSSERSIDGREYSAPDSGEHETSEENNAEHETSEEKNEEHETSEENNEEHKTSEENNEMVWADQTLPPRVEIDPTAKFTGVSTPLPLPHCCTVLTADSHSVSTTYPSSCKSPSSTTRLRLDMMGGQNTNIVRNRNFVSMKTQAKW